MNIILETVVGSTLHGTSVDDGLEDLDLMAIGIEPMDKILGFFTEDTIVKRTKPVGVRSEAGDVDYVCYGLRKYLNLALKGNPTILLALFSTGENVRLVTKEGRELQALAPYIVSKKVFDPFRGYMKQQYDRLMGLSGQKNVTRPELIEKYGFDTKYAGHIVRLGLQGIELLMTGKLRLPMQDLDRKLVVDVRTGKYSLEEIGEIVKGLEQGIILADRQSKLPEAPNWAKVEEWMLKTYANVWHETRNQEHGVNYV